jgi:hypothetical protein
MPMRRGARPAWDPLASARPPKRELSVLETQSTEKIHLTRLLMAEAALELPPNERERELAEVLRALGIHSRMEVSR